MMIAQVCDLALGICAHHGRCPSVYQSSGAEYLQFARPLPLPQMHLNPEVKDIFGFAYKDFELFGYECHGGIKAPIAV